MSSSVTRIEETPAALDGGNAPQRCSLYFTEGSSDKEYHTQLHARDGGFVVDFQYGRRGAALQAGTKTVAALPYDKALKVYTKLVAEKMAKGYTPEESGEVFQSTPVGQSFTGQLPQLLNAISVDELGRYLDDPNWMLQLKYDGERRGLKVDGSGVTGSNKKGILVALPKNIEEAAQRLHTSMGSAGALVLDGEIIGNKLYVWDVLEIGGQDVRGKSAKDRCMMAQGLSPLMASSACIEVCHTGFTRDEKRNLLNAYRNAGLEGVTLKDIHAPSVSGRPSSGGTQVKFKFWESCTLEVSHVNAQRSVAVQGYDDNGLAVPLGNVTIAPNKAIPAVGDIVEVKYLYAYPNGSIVQPEFLGVRLDQDRNDCLLSQLKFKADEAVAMKKLIRP